MSKNQKTGEKQKNKSKMQFQKYKSNSEEFKQRC